MNDPWTIYNKMQLFTLFDLRRARQIDPNVLIDQLQKETYNSKNILY